MTLCSWYHPGITRHIAECLLLSRDIKDGTYLLRQAGDALALSVRLVHVYSHAEDRITAGLLAYQVQSAWLNGLQLQRQYQVLNQPSSCHPQLLTPPLIPP